MHLVYNIVLPHWTSLIRPFITIPPISWLENVGPLLYDRTSWIKSCTRTNREHRGRPGQVKRAFQVFPHLVPPSRAPRSRGREMTCISTQKESTTCSEDGTAT